MLLTLALHIGVRQIRRCQAICAKPVLHRSRCCGHAWSGDVVVVVAAAAWELLSVSLRVRRSRHAEGVKWLMEGERGGKGCAEPLRLRALFVHKYRAKKTGVRGFLHGGEGGVNGR